jgi:hypothetical protein
MKNHKYALMFCLIFLFAAVFALSTPTLAADWDGSADTSWYTADPGASSFEIDSAEALAGLAQIVNDATDDFAGDTVTLTADLDLGGNHLLGIWSGEQWTPIGNSSNRFAGTFNGNGKQIENLYIDTDDNFQGLFGYIDETGKIRDLSITSGSVSSTNDYIAGLAGMSRGSILCCENRATVTGNHDVGGIVGSNSGYVVMCANAGEISPSVINTSGILSGIGGIAGRGGNVSKCYNVAHISSPSENITKVGGICGSNSSVSQAYSIGAITGHEKGTGGISGGGGDYSECFYLKTDTINASIYSVGNTSAPTEDAEGTAAKDVDGLQSADTLAALGDAFVADSENINDGYPVLSWQATGTYPDDETVGLDIASAPSDLTNKSFTVTMNKLLEYTTLAASSFDITATINGEDCTIIPTDISQADGDTATVVTLSFDSVLAEAEVVYHVQYLGGDVYNSASFTTPPSDYWSEYAARSFDSGTGTVSDPYQIRTVEQLAYFGKTDDIYEGSFFVLTDNIDLSGKLWTPKEFCGCFDGQGHSLSGLNINQSSGNIGFFSGLNRDGAAGNVSYVANLHLIAPELTSNSGFMGAFAGLAQDVHLYNCSVEGGTLSPGSLGTVGGLIGQYSTSSDVGITQISGCFCTAALQGNRTSGGLIGKIQHGNEFYGITIMQDCWTGGSVSGLYAGGLVGEVSVVRGFEIERCFSTATLDGANYYVGGLLAYGNYNVVNRYSMGDAGVTISNSVSLNPSVSTTYTTYSPLSGRIIANGDDMIAAGKGTFSNNYGWDQTLVNGEYIDGDETSNGINLSTDMSSAQNFWAETLGFDFDSTWEWTGETNHPQLKTQVMEDVYAINFTMQPHDATAYRTKTASFGVIAAGGTMHYTYQWQCSTDNGETWDNIDEATADALSIGYQDGYDSGTLFRCVVTDISDNTATSDSAELTVVTAKYMPDNALQDIESHYENKGALNTASEAFALRTVEDDLSGYELNLPACYTYFTQFDSNRGYFPWIMMDLYAQGADPQDYVINNNGINDAFNIIDFYLNIVQDDETGSFESHFHRLTNPSTPGNVLTNEYAIPSIITGMEMYFDGDDWGNESEDTKLGRDGAIEYVFSLLQEDVSGGKTLGTLKTGGGTSNDGLLARASQRGQCEFVLLMVRLADDPVYGEQATEAMHDVLKAMEAFYDDGNLTNTEAGGYYVSALIGAASVTDGYFKRTGYLNLADDILKEIIANSQSTDGGYSAVIGSSTANADAYATAAMMMALGDYNNETALFADFTYTISDETSVKNDMAQISLAATVTDDLTLPAEGKYGSTITWTTSNKNAVTAAGKVTRTTVDVPVILTATVTKGESSQSKSFTVTVKADADATTDDVDAALSAISIPDETIADITVPDSTVEGVSFTWETSNSDVLAIDGTVVRPVQGSDNVTITLTVTATKDSLTKTKDFEVLVYAMDSDYMEGYYTGRMEYLADRDLEGYWEIFAAYALLGDYIQDPNNGYTFSLATPASSWYGTQYGATVLAICMMGENPYDYNGVNWLQRLKDNYGGSYAGGIFSQLAMVAAGADSSYYTASPASGISMTQPESMTNGIDMAGWASEILAIYAGDPEVDTAAADIIQFMQDLGVEESGNFTGVNVISTSCVVSGLAALYAAGYTDADPTADTWVNESSGKNILDVIYDDFIIEGMTPNYLEQGYMALGDTINAKNGGTSVWIACAVNEEMLNVQIAKANTILENESLYTEESIAALETALTAANNISDDRLNARIIDYGEEYFNLLDAVKNIKTLNSTQQDAIAAAVVTEQINALPAADSITLDDKDDVTAARTAYDSLTEDQQDLIEGDVLTKLTSVEAVIEALEAEETAVNTVVDMINALPGTIRLADESAVTAARTAYDGLSETQKAKVNATVLAKLTAAESAIAALKGNKANINDMKDVASNAWFYDNVAYVLEQGIMKGTSTTTFDPGGRITRGQFITILGRYAGIEDSSADHPSATSFSDVKSTSYYAAHVAWAVENGITNGTTATTFSPNDKISRQDMSVMIARYAEAMDITLPDGSNESQFKDHNKISDYATEAVYRMKAAGILQGDEKNYFNPQYSATRAEAAAVIERFITYCDNIVPDPEPEPEADIVTFSVEKFTLGQGYIVVPMLVEISDGDTVADVFENALTEQNVEYYSSDTDMGFYLRRIKDNDTSEANIPQYIQDVAGDNIDCGRDRENWLGEFDYTSQGGWVYWVNNEQPEVSAGSYEVENGDVIRWQFTVYGLGRDVGAAIGALAPYITVANKDALTTAIATINTDNDTTAMGSDAYADALTVLMNMESTQNQVDSALTALE